MSYTIQTKIASKKGWYTPAESKKYYGTYSRTGATCHWWNAPSNVKDSDHDNIVNYMAGRASKGLAPTANYIVSNKKITMQVHPDNVAWHASSGNPTTIGIEFSPHLNAEGYKKAGWLIWQLEKRYNRKLTLFPHSYWSQTQCPGSLKLNVMRAEANRWARGDYNPKPSPLPTPKLTWSKLNKKTVYVTNKQPTKLWDFNKTSWTMKEVKKFNKGEKITIYGKCVNENLGATYYVTEYSYLKKITNGFNSADLDVYVEPKPVPTPEPPKPEPKPEVPSPELPPEESDYEKRLVALEKIVIAIKRFLEGIFKVKF